jgi:hypothetical protein
MNAMRARVALMGLAALGSGIAAADPRDIAEPPVPLTPEMQEARRVQMATDMDVWLRRLEGRFRIEGVFYRDGEEADARHAKGMEDCVTIGPGAGMQCVINVIWDEDYGADGQSGQTGVSALAPAMIEYGFDPVASRIRSLQVDNQSLAEPGEGTLKGQTMSSSTRCANTPAAQLCQRVTRVYIPPDRSYISVTIEVERNYDRVSSLSLDLRPMTLEEAAAAAAEARMPRVPSDQELDTPRARARQNSSRPPAGLPGGGGGRSGGGGSRR